MGSARRGSNPLGVDFTILPTPLTAAAVTGHIIMNAKLAVTGASILDSIRPCVQAA